jgi:hypothetical protein
MTTSSRPNWSLALGLPLLVTVICAVMVYSPFFAEQNARLSTAVTLDLTVTAPLLYFLAIRKTSVPKRTVVRVFVAGVLVAGLLLGSRSPLLHGIKTWISPVIEGAVVITVIWNIRQARRKVGSAEMDMLMQLRTLAANILGNERAGDVMGSELAVIYYALAGRRRKETAQRRLEFSYARASGAIPVLNVFLMAMVAESIGLHFLIARWSVPVAWVLTGLSAYTMLQLYAHMRAMKIRLVRLKEGILYLRNGLAADARVRVDNIEEITLTKRSAREEGVLKLALFGALEAHSICIRLRQPITVSRMFGIRRQAKVLLFAVDEPEELREAINRHMSVRCL